MEQITKTAAEGVGMQTASGSEFGSRFKNASDDHGDDKIAMAAGRGVEDRIQVEIAQGTENGGDVAVREGTGNEEGVGQRRRGRGKRAGQGQAKSIDLVRRKVREIGECASPDVAILSEGLAEKEGGRAQKVEKWGKKRLAYPIKKQREAYYVLLTIEGPASLVHEVERRIRVTDGVLKFITVRVDEDLRKAASRKARRGDDKRPPVAPPKPEGAEEVQP